MAETWEYCKDVKGISGLMDAANVQRETLQREVAKYCGERGVAAS